MNFDRTINVSEFEFEIIKAYRKLVKHGFGELALTVSEGHCVNMRESETKGRKELMELQK